MTPMTYAEVQKFVTALCPPDTISVQVYTDDNYYSVTTSVADALKLVHEVLGAEAPDPDGDFVTLMIQEGHVSMAVMTADEISDEDFEWEHTHLEEQYQKDLARIRKARQSMSEVERLAVDLAPWNSIFVEVDTPHGGDYSCYKATIISEELVRLDHEVHSSDAHDAHEVTGDVGGDLHVSVVDT